MSYTYDCFILLLALTIPRADGIRSGIGRKRTRSDPCDSDSVELAIAIPSVFFIYSRWNQKFLTLLILSLA